MDPKLYLRHIVLAFGAYQNHNVTEQAFRQDGKVPYTNHALWAATTILLDTALPWEIRELGFVVLLYHDVLEDTSSPLPPAVTYEARQCIEAMTFENFRASLPLIPGLPVHIKLFILVDKLSTLIEEHIPETKVESRKLWKETVLYLAAEVEKYFGRTRIVIMAEAMAAATPW